VGSIDRRQTLRPWRTDFWIDAPITVRIGDENAAGTLPPVVLTGKVLAATVDGGVLKIALCDPAADLKKPLLTARYGGTGNLDGPANGTARSSAACGAGRGTSRAS